MRARSDARARGLKHRAASRHANLGNELYKSDALARPLHTAIRRAGLRLAFADQFALIRRTPAAPLLARPPARGRPLMPPRGAVELRVHRPIRRPRLGDVLGQREIDVAAIVGLALLRRRRRRLIAAQAAHGQRDRRRNREAKRLGDLGQVEVVHVEDALERVRGVALDVSAEAVARRLVQVEVLGDELLELRQSVQPGSHLPSHLTLDVRNLVVREAILVERHLGRLEEAQKPKLGRQKEEQALAGLTGARCPTDAVDVVARVVGRVELDDPVDFGDVESAGSVG